MWGGAGLTGSVRQVCHTACTRSVTQHVPSVSHSMPDTAPMAFTVTFLYFLEIFLLLVILPNSSSFVFFLWLLDHGGIIQETLQLGSMAAGAPLPEQPAAA